MRNAKTVIRRGAQIRPWNAGEEKIQEEVRRGLLMLNPSRILIAQAFGCTPENISCLKRSWREGRTYVDRCAQAAASEGLSNGLALALVPLWTAIRAAHDSFSTQALIRLHTRLVVLRTELFPVELKATLEYLATNIDGREFAEAQISGAATSLHLGMVALILADRGEEVRRAR